MPNIGPMELIIVLVIALLILGPARLPAAGRSLGRGVREFRDGITGRDSAPPEIDATRANPNAALAQSDPVSPSLRERTPEHVEPVA